MDYGVFLVTKRGGRYTNYNPDETHYDDPIDHSPGRPAGNSRRWGDASADVQKQAIDTIIELGRDYGLDNHDLAHVLAIAWQESGFNPDAAAGTTNASGLGQFVDKTGRSYGLNDENRFDIRANADALIRHFLDNKRHAEARGQGDAYIYKYHHDGWTRDYGGLSLAKQRVLPKLEVFEKALDGDGGTPGLLGRILKPIEDFIQVIGGLFGRAKNQSAPRKDPIILDLNGDGINTLPPEVGVYFDHDSNGFAERSGWVNSGDGFLVLDRNGDGRITNGEELFGDQTPLQTGIRAQDGFAALREWDAVGNGGNADGKLSADDAAWGSVRVWQDVDVNGFSDEEELHTLTELGITEIALSPAPVGREDSEGNLEVQTARFSRQDGSEGSAGEFQLSRRPTDTIWDPIEVPEDISALPDVEGSGNVRSLQETMVLDHSGVLRAAVESFAVEPDAVQRSALVQDILYGWVGAESISPNARGEAMDARKLAVLEAFLGEPYTGAIGSNPVPDAAVLLESAYHALAERVYAELASQTTLKVLFDLIVYRWSEAAQGLSPDYQAVTEHIDAELAVAPSVGIDLLAEFARAIRGFGASGTSEYEQLRTLYATRGEDLAIAFDSGGRNVISDADSTNTMRGTTGADLLAGGEGNDSITAYDGDDVIYGGEGDDVLSGCENDDQLYGGVGSDHLFGAENNDTLDGGTGNDRLNGGTGNDVYILAPGTGQDEIVDYDTTAGNVDAIRIDPSAAGLAVDVWRRGNDLYVGLEGTDDTMQVRDWFSGTAYRVEEVILADGSRITADQLAVARFVGSAQADVITGSTDDDYLDGLAGDDILYGGRGDDVLDGGAGNDILYGGSSGYTPSAGAGNDTYRFGRGYGQDTIYDYDTTGGNRDTVELVGLNRSDVGVRMEGRDFLIGVNGTSDVLRVKDWTLGPAHRVERVLFADGTVLEGATLVAPFLGTAGDDNLSGTAEDEVLLGLDGNDFLYGRGGNDLLDGGAGNDILYGGGSGYTGNPGAGNDTYLFGRGYGSDVIYDYDTTAGNLDTIELKDLNAADVTIRRDSTSFYIVVNGTADQLRVADWGLGAAARIERVRFADGSVLEGPALAAPFLGTTGDDTLTGTTEDDVLLGLDGNDILYGGVGNDVLDGGAGNDTLYGGGSGYAGNPGAGNDTYLFGRGYGADVIYDYDTTAGNLDTVRLKDLNAADVTIKRVGNSFVLSVNGSSDELRVADWGLEKACRIERIEFADGSVLEGAELVAPFLGTAGNDTLTGTTEDDVLLGLDGNDLLYGGAGDDVLDGGAGNDTLYGGLSGYAANAGAGNDTYVFGRGYGADVIYDYDGTAGNVDTVRLKDLNAADVTVKRVGNYFVLAVNGSSDELRVADWGLGKDYRIERIEFADGSVLEGEDLVAPFLGTAGNDTLSGTTDDDVLMGLGGNDVLLGSGGNDVLDGSGGNDALYGGTSGYTSTAGAGNDTYIFGRSYGSDIIYDYDGTPGNLDTIELADLNAADVTIYRDNSSFYIAVNDSADRIRVADWGLGAVARIERVKFADGSVLEGAALAATPFVGTDMGEALNGTADGDVLKGLGGNDTLTGAGGDDILDGGAGNDTLRGGIGGYTSRSGAGNDTYLFGRGYGVDNVYDFDDTPGNLDTIRLLDLNAADVTIRRNATTFFIDVNGAGDQIKVNDWGSGAAYRIERVEFADGSALSAADLARVPYLGTAGVDSFTGTAENEFMYGLGGNDTLNGMAGDDLLDGGDGTDTVSGGDGNDVVLGGAGNDTLYGGTGGDLLDGGSGADRMSGNAGDDVFRVDDPGDQVTELSNEGNDTVLTTISYTLADKPNLENVTLEASADLNATGNAANNVLIGNGSNNILSGAAGDDILRGANGNDRLDGGSGNDALDGGAGDDTYMFGRGYGAERIAESNGGGNDTVQVSSGVLPSEVSVSLVGDSLMLAINGTADTLTFEHWYDAAGRIEQIVFADGTRWEWATLRAQRNRGPVSASAPGEIVVDEDSALSQLLGPTIFADADADDRIALSVSRADGGALPGWLAFDAASGALTGTPRNEDVEALELRLTGSDLYGASAAVQFVLSVRNTNDAPVAGAAPEARVALEDDPFIFTLAPDAFRDEDAGDGLTLSARRANGDALPAWLTFDAALGAFMGMPSNADVGTLQVQITATDQAGASASSTFQLTVLNVNDAPVAGLSLPGYSATEDAPFSLTLAPDAFTDEDADDTLTLTARQANGDALPGWLSFDATGRTFSGTPANADLGDILVEVAATDHAGASAAAVFGLTVHNVNDAPVLTAPFPAQFALEDAAFSYTVPADAFVDEDAGDYLTYFAWRANGNALPEWLTFDQSTREFAGTPTNADVGTLEILVSAADRTDGLAAGILQLSVHNVNDAPVAGLAPPAQTAIEDALFALVLAPDAFSDADAGDILTLSARQANGDALPGWLSFDVDSRTLVGVPINDDVGVVRISVSATDLAGAVGTIDFDLTVANTNDAPVAIGAVSDQIAPEGVLFELDVSDGLFSDADVGDTLTLAATAANGALPAWLSFDAQTRRLTGTPGNEDAGSWQVLLTATDAAGASAAAEFLVAVPRAVGVQLDGTAQADVLSGTTGDDAITGAAGDDALEGGGGNDRLDGGIGADTLDGGSGDDALLFSADTTWVRPSTAPSYSDTVAYARWQELYWVDGRTRSGDLFVGGAGEDVLVGTAADDAFVFDESAYEAVAQAPRYLQIETYLGGDGDDVIDLRSTLLVHPAATLDGGNGDDLLFGNAGSDVLVGAAGNDDLDGGAGADSMFGGEGYDTYYVDDPGDQVAELANEGIDSVHSTIAYVLPEHVEHLMLHAIGVHGTGNALDNYFLSMSNNVLRGEAGNDQFQSVGVDDVFIGGPGDDLYTVNGRREQVVELADEGFDEVRARRDYRLPEHVEKLSLIGAVAGYGNGGDNIVVGSSGSNYLGGEAGDDVLQGLEASDVIQGGEGADRLEGDGGAVRVLTVTAKGSSARGVPPGMQVRVDGVLAGQFDVSADVYTSYTVGVTLDPDAAHAIDVVFVNDAYYPSDSPPQDRNLYVSSVRWGETTLGPTSAGVTYDVGSGAAAFDGVDVRAGQSTMAWNGALRFKFSPVVANDVLDGGAGADSLEGGEGNDLIAGGLGNDSIDTGGGMNIVLHNAGDGADRVQLGGTRATVSLGGGTAYEDLALRRVGSDLVLETGAEEGVTLAEWYGAGAAQPEYLSLQTISAAMAEFDPGSADALLSKKVQQFDLKRLAQEYDQARAGDATLDRWTLMNRLLDARLAASDIEAVGGDLAYQYGTAGSLAGIGLTAAQQVMSAPQFGAQAQSLRPLSELQTGSVKLT